MEFLLLATAHFTALLSPGVDFFIIIKTAIRKPIKNSIILIFGIVSAHSIYLIFAILGIEVINKVHILSILLSILGGIYLTYIGYKFLMSKPIKIENKDEDFKDSDYITGFLTAFLNPKNSIFYLSLFTSIVSRDTSLGIRILYALWMVSVVFLWDLMVAYFINSSKLKDRAPQYINYIEKGAGVVLILIGFGIIIDKLSLVWQ